MRAKCPHCGAELYECTDEQFEDSVYQVHTEYYCEVCYVYWYPYEVAEFEGDDD